MSVNHAMCQTSGLQLPNVISELAACKLPEKAKAFMACCHLKAQHFAAKMLLVHCLQQPVHLLAAVLEQKSAKQTSCSTGRTSEFRLKERCGCANGRAHHEWTPQAKQATSNFFKPNKRTYSSAALPRRIVGDVAHGECLSPFLLIEYLHRDLTTPNPPPDCDVALAHERPSATRQCREDTLSSRGPAWSARCDTSKTRPWGGSASLGPKAPSYS